MTRNYVFILFGLSCNLNDKDNWSCQCCMSNPLIEKHYTTWNNALAERQIWGYVLECYCVFYVLLIQTKTILIYRSKVKITYYFYCHKYAFAWNNLCWMFLQVQKKSIFIFFIYDCRAIASYQNVQIIFTDLMMICDISK